MIEPSECTKKTLKLHLDNENQKRGNSLLDRQLFCYFFFSTNIAAANPATIAIATAMVEYMIYVPVMCAGGSDGVSSGRVCNFRLELLTLEQRTGQRRQAR
jgi:hypothetical protein